MVYQSQFTLRLKLEEGKKKTKHFSELIRTYTIRDYSFNPHTMLAYGKALRCWPSSDSIHTERSTHLAVHRKAQTIAQMRVHPLKYKMRHCKPHESD